MFQLICCSLFPDKIKDAKIIFVVGEYILIESVPDEVGDDWNTPNGDYFTVTLRLVTVLFLT